MSTLRQIEANRRTEVHRPHLCHRQGRLLHECPQNRHPRQVPRPPHRKRRPAQELVEDSYRSFHPPPPKPAAWSTSSSTANGPSAASVPPKPNRGNTRISTHSTVPTSTPSDIPPPYTRTPSPDSSTGMDATRRARERALQSIDSRPKPPRPPPHLPNRPSPPNPPSLITSHQTSSPLIGFVLPTPTAAPPEPPVSRPS